RFALEGKVFQFKALVMGASPAPYLHQQLMNVICRHLRTKGIVVSCYLDNFWITAPTQQKCQHHMDTLVALLRKLGWIVPTKKIVSPSQRLEHLGHIWDSVKMEVSIPAKRLHSLKKEAWSLIRNTKATARQLGRVIGRLISMSLAVFPARLFCRMTLVHQ